VIFASVILSFKIYHTFCFFVRACSDLQQQTKKEEEEEEEQECAGHRACFFILKTVSSNVFQ